MGTGLDTTISVCFVLLLFALVACESCYARTSPSKQAHFHMLGMHWRRSTCAARLLPDGLHIPALRSQHKFFTQLHPRRVSYRLTSAVSVPCGSACLPPGQAFFEEVRTQLSSATELSAPASKAAMMAMTAAAGRNGCSSGARPRVRMFVSLDFEWWEKSSDTILEVGWSLWDTVTQRHRTRHWIIRDNLNKVSSAACGW